MSTRNHSLKPAVIALGTAALLALSGLTLAQQPQVTPAAFPAMDQNGDGQVSAAEFGQFRAQRMAARAAQGRPMRNAANAPTFERLDTNGDGYLSPAEVSAHQQARFAARGGGRGAGCRQGGGPGAGMAGSPCWRNQ